MATATTGNENGLPSSQTLKFYDADEGEKMEFRLIYQGRLRSERSECGSSTGPKGRAEDKQQLRKHFHPQLRELWKQHPDLRSQASAFCYLSNRGQEGKKLVFVDDRLASAGNVQRYIDHLASNYQRCNGRFVPLVSEVGGFTCALDILFLRRDNPGSLVHDGGDIDNRIKVLLDGLRMPKTTQELGGLTIDPADEDPFFCLLEDDSLLTRLSVTTDRLLSPQKAAEDIHDVLLEIHVTVINPGAIFAGGRLV
jgi:hypothetical protein